MITLQEFINKTKGTEVSVPWGFKGECVSLVQMYLNECCDVPLKARGNANVYCQNIVNSGYGKYVDTPQRGDIINYDTPNDWNPYGHVAIVVNPDEIYHQWAGHGARFGSINQNQKRLYVVRPNNILVENVVEPVESKFKVGQKVQIIHPINYDNNTKFQVYYNVYDVLQVSGARIVIGIGDKVTSAIHQDNIKLYEAPKPQGIQVGDKIKIRANAKDSNRGTYFADWVYNSSFVAMNIDANGNVGFGNGTAYTGEVSKENCYKI